MGTQPPERHRADAQAFGALLERLYLLLDVPCSPADTRAFGRMVDVGRDLASRLRADDFREKFSGRWTKASSDDEQVVLLQPQTFMNESGRSVQPAATFFKAGYHQVTEIQVFFGGLA